MAAEYIIADTKAAILADMANKVESSSGQKKIITARRHAATAKGGTFHHPLLDTSDLDKFEAAVQSPGPQLFLAFSTRVF
jgi:hypothetical protein